MHIGTAIFAPAIIWFAIAYPTRIYMLRQAIHLRASAEQAAEESGNLFHAATDETERQRLRDLGDVQTIVAKSMTTAIDFITKFNAPLDRKKTARLLEKL